MTARGVADTATRRRMTARHAAPIGSITKTLTVDALHEYRTHPLFSDRERAFAFAGERTERKRVSPETFAKLSRYYTEREICEIVWIVSSNFLMNINNLGLSIGSDGLCEL